MFSDLDKTSLWPVEFYEILDVLEMGAKKHGNNNWLQPNGKKSSVREMHASIQRHLAQDLEGITADHESGFHPLLHAACRCLMQYTKYRRGIVHVKDENYLNKEVFL